ncbi:hypothetical protein ACOALZ_08560 [Nocardiopsis algeriensis]
MGVDGENTYAEGEEHFYDEEGEFGVGVPVPSPEDPEDGFF